MLDLLKRGVHVYYLDISETFPVRNCTHPSTSLFRSSVVSVLSAYSNFTLLAPPVMTSLQDCNIIDQILSIGDVEDLCLFEYEGYAIGPCLKSYVIDQTRTATPSLTESSRLALEAFSTAKGVIDCFDALDLSSLVSALVLFNGRYPVAWSAREYFRKAGKDIFYHERGATMHQYQLIDHMPHDYYAWARGYKELDRRDQEQFKHYLPVAESWLSNKLLKNDQQTANFGNNSVAGLAESLFSDTSHITITHFTVSFDEWTSLPANIYPRSAWSDEFSALQAILSIIRRFQNIQLIIRVHPNNLNKDPMDQARIHDIHLPANAILIPAESKVDSYELLTRSSAVFTYGSSIGYEAAYLGLPVYIFGRCLYDKLDCVYPLRTYRDLVKVVKNISSSKPLPPTKRRKPHARSNFYHYAFMRQQASLPFHYYKPIDKHCGRFLGLQNPYISLLRQRLPKL